MILYILTCRFLEEPQAEPWQGSYDVLDDVGCYVLMGDPVFLAGEEVELYRQTFRCGLELAHEDAEIGVDLGEGTEIMLGGGAEETEVHRVAVRSPAFGPCFRGEAFQLFRGAEPDGIHVYIEGTGYSAALTLAHSAPVLERIADQGVGRNGYYRIVPVADLDRVQGHFLHRTVDTVFFHDYRGLYP